MQLDASYSSYIPQAILLLEAVTDQFAKPFASTDVAYAMTHSKSASQPVERLGDFHPSESSSSIRLFLCGWRIARANDNSQ